MVLPIFVLVVGAVVGAVVASNQTPAEPVETEDEKEERELTETLDGLKAECKTLETEYSTLTSQKNQLSNQRNQLKHDESSYADAGNTGPEIKQKLWTIHHDKLDAERNVQHVEGEIDKLEHDIESSNYLIGQYKEIIGHYDNKLYYVDLPKNVSSQLEVINKEHDEVGVKVAELKSANEKLEEDKRQLDTAKYIAYLLDEALGNIPMRKKCTLDFYLKKYGPEVQTVVTEKEKWAKECNVINKQISQLTGLDEKNEELDRLLNEAKEETERLNKEKIQKDESFDRIMKRFAAKQGPGFTEKQLQGQIRALMTENDDLEKLLKGFKQSEQAQMRLMEKNNDLEKAYNEKRAIKNRARRINDQENNL